MSERSGHAMHALIGELFPICRSITGDGMRQTLRRLQADIPLELVEVPVPEKLLEDEINTRKHNLEHHQLGQMGLDLEKYLEIQGKTVEEFDAETKEAAVKGIKTQFVLDELVSKEKLNVNQEELTEHLMRRAASSGMSPDQFAQAVVQNNQVQLLVGELNQGWQVANATLAHERNMLGSTTRTQQMFNGLLHIAQTRQRYGKPASADPVVRQKLAGLMIRVEAMKYHSLRQLTDALKKRSPGIGASVNKLVSTELNHDIAALALEILGNYAWLTRRSAHVIDRGVWPYDFMFTLGLIIGGGTSQIQKNIISERGLGMPRS